MRRLLAKKLDPSVQRKAERMARANTVKEVASEWVELQTEIDPGTRDTHAARLRLHVFPRLGNRPIASVTASELLDVLRRIEKSPSRNCSKLEIAKRVRQLCGQIWRYAVSTDRAQHDIAHDLRDAMATPKVTHLAAVVEPTAIGALLRAIWGYAGSPVTMAALKLSALTAARPGEMRHMEWNELDFEQAIWKIPKGKMKRRIEHWGPLSTQALEILRDIQLLTGSERKAKYVFPGLRTASRPMSENTVNGAIRRLGYQSGEQTAHGFRRVTDHNEELYSYLRRFVGYLLVGNTSDQSLHFLYGLGANGKSVFCEVIMRLMGEYAIAVAPDLIMLKRYGGIPNDVARLRGKRAALMNETSQGSKFDEAKLKDLTGCDTLTARFLHQEFFDFRPTHRIVIRGNHKPAINGMDEGIWRRLRLVPFTVTIPEDERDHQLLGKLADELPGILSWALQGLREWQESGLRPPAIITEAVLAYRDESDTLGRFIAECCTARPHAQVKSSSFFSRYREFAEQAGERFLSSKEVPHEMQRRGFAH